MNPHEEKELEREEGQDLLDRLILLTKKDRLTWKCDGYVTLDVDEDTDTNLPELSFLGHTYTVVTHAEGKQYRAKVNEYLTLDGSGGMGMDLEITPNVPDGEKYFYDKFSNESIGAFIDAMLPLIVDSDEVRNMCDKSPMPSEYASAENRGNPIVRLGDRLFRQRELLEFHRAVVSPVTLKELLSK